MATDVKWPPSSPCGRRSIRHPVALQFSYFMRTNHTCCGLGMCRQFIREFAELSMPVFMFGGDGGQTVTTLGEVGFCGICVLCRYIDINISYSPWHSAPAVYQSHPSSQDTVATLDSRWVWPGDMGLAVGMGKIIFHISPKPSVGIYWHGFYHQDFERCSSVAFVVLKFYEPGWAIAGWAIADSSLHQEDRSSC